jgi:CDP-diglyceride synthetase
MRYTLHGAKLQRFNTQKISIKNETIASEILFPDFSKFKNEVEWNEYYNKMSKEWIINNPKKALSFFLKKINNFYLSYKKTPYSIYENENQENNIKRIDKIFTTVWLVEGRIFLLATILLIIKRYMNNDKFMKIQSIIIILILLAYSIPYLIGFNYERHITPFLLIMIICFFSLTTTSQKK